MAVIVKAGSRQALVDSIYKAIDDKRIVTWDYDADRDFRHTPDQWRGRGWMRPTVAWDALYFGLLGPKDTVMTKSVYAVYHGRFAEMLLEHFDVSISEIRITPFALSPYDNFTASSS